MQVLPKLLNTVRKDYYWRSVAYEKCTGNEHVAAPPLPLPLRGRNRPDKFLRLSLRSPVKLQGKMGYSPVIFLSSKSVRSAKSSFVQNTVLTPGCLGLSWVLSVVFGPCLILHSGHFLTKEISRDTSKEGAGTCPVDFHHVAAEVAVAAAGSFPGVKTAYSRTPRTNK